MRVSGFTVLRSRLIMFVVGVLLLSPCAAHACPGDCNEDGIVTVDELVRGVGVALGDLALSACPALDLNGNGDVTIDELVNAVNGALNGCPATPTPEPTSTPTVTLPPTATMTPRPNQPPEVTRQGVYHGYPGQPIERPIQASDPDGDQLTYTAQSLPDGSTLNEQTGVLSWVPSEDQVGPLSVVFTVTDDGVSPRSVHGELIFQIDPVDPCSDLTCDAAVGCTASLPPLGAPCCMGVPEVRVAQAVTDCPNGQVLFVGGNLRGFGRFQNCDLLRVRLGFQGGTTVPLNFETRCFNLSEPISVRARLETADVVLFDRIDPLRFESRGDGYQQALLVGYRVTDAVDPQTFESQEADLTVTASQFGGATLTRKVRVTLTLESIPDLPDL
jgi:hypothetical protein